MATLKDPTYNFQEESTEETTKTQPPILLVEELEETWVIMVMFKSEEATHQTSKVEISDHHTREVTTTM